MKKEKASKSTFINIDVSNPPNLKFFFINILFLLIWVIGLTLIFFRIDLLITKHLPANIKWINNIIPLFYLFVILMIMYLQRWYYNLALVFYPLLIIFWFVPKFVLSKGKIYLFFSYINYVWGSIREIKSSIFHFGLFISAFFLLLIIDSHGIRIFSMIISSYFYIRYVTKYIKSTFSTPQLFSSKFESSLTEIVESPAGKNEIIKSFEERSTERKLSEEEKKRKQLERLILLNYGLDYIGQSLSGIKGKRAYIISWILKLILFVAISFIYLTFINYELFLIDNTNFKVLGTPSFFHFFYYTVKSITFNSIDIITPVSILAMCIEMFSYFIIGIFVLILSVSVFFSSKMDYLNANIKKATDLCIKQNQTLAEYIKDKYQTDIQTAMIEFGNIQKSLETLKKIIDRIF